MAPYVLLHCPLSPYVPSCRYLWPLCLSAPPYVPPMSPPADIYGPCLVASPYVPPMSPPADIYGPYVSSHCPLSLLCPLLQISMPSMSRRTALCPCLCLPYVPSCRYLWPPMSCCTALCPLLYPLQISMAPMSRHTALCFPYVPPCPLLQVSVNRMTVISIRVLVTEALFQIFTSSAIILCERAREKQGEQYCLKEQCSSDLLPHCLPKLS